MKQPCQGDGLECGLIDRRVRKTLSEAPMAVFGWNESWYNPRELYSSPWRLRDRSRSLTGGSNRVSKIGACSADLLLKDDAYR